MKKLNYYLLINVFVISFYGMNLSAKIDTLWTKNDFRLTNTDFVVLNDSIILTYMWLGNEANSTPKIDGNYKKYVKYNINSMTYTNIFETFDASTSTSNEIIVSDDKSKLVLVSPKNAEHFESIYIFNIKDGSLDTILDFTSNKIYRNIKKTNDGKISFITTSDKLSEYGKPIQYLGILDLSTYQITYHLFPISIDISATEAIVELGIIDHEIIKSDREGVEQEVIFYTFSYNYFGVISFNFDENFRNNESNWSYMSETYFNRVDKIYYLRDYKYMAYEYEINDKANIFVNPTNSGISFNNNISSKVAWNSQKIIGNDFNKNNFILRFTEKINNISRYYISYFDITSNRNLDSMFIDLPANEVFSSNERQINRIKAINDSIFISIINGSVIKFEINESKLSVSNSNNKYKLFPNPTTGEVNFKFYNNNSGLINWNIINVNGNKILSNNQFFGLGENNLQINISQLINGIYFLKVGENTVKIVLEK